MYNVKTVKGQLMKRIKKKGIFHQSNFHRRHFELNFSSGLIIVKKKENDITAHKKIPLDSLHSCTVAQEDEY